MSLSLSLSLNSLGLPRAPADTRVVVGMSGGVDSSVAAAMLVEAGYQVIGITLQLYDHGAAIKKPGACCAGQDIRDAAAVAAQLGIPHYVLDYESRFRQQVIDDFADSYVRGETPIPCVRCNQTVKFRDLLRAAQDLGAEALATGHYVRRIDGPAGPELHRGADPARDQSYFLFATTREQLAFLRFPLGDMPKQETRAIAGRLGLGVAQKPDSQDICFVPAGRYDALVAKLRPEAIVPGDIVDLAGNPLARHEGIIHYTVGQRRGLNLSGFEEPLFVIRLDPARAEVVVGPRSALAQSDVVLGEVNWLDPDAAQAVDLPVMVKLRSAQPPVAARLTAKGDQAVLALDEPVLSGVAPGQAGVVYIGDRVICGGWIKRAEAGAG